MKKLLLIVFVLVSVLVTWFVVVASNDTLVCHKPGTPAEKWLWINENAKGENSLEKHLGHGDVAWPEVTVCDDVEVPYDPPPNPDDPTPTPKPIDPEPSPIQELTVKLLYLPIIRNDCVEGWPWCSTPDHSY